MKPFLPWLWTLVIGLTVALALAGADARGAEHPGVAGSAPGSVFHLKVDFTAPRGQDDHQPLPATHREGWWPWVLPDGDYYRSDLVWENGTSSYPKDAPGIAGSGVHAALTCHYEGILTLHVAGPRRNLAGGAPPTKSPIYEPLCNTWAAGSDFPNNPSSDVLLALYELPAGAYRLASYHNSFNGRRFGNNPTGVEYTEAREPEPPMASIRVYSLKTLVSEYFERPLKPETLPKGKQHGTSVDKIVVDHKAGAGDVRQTREARNVVIQQVQNDAELKPSIIEFSTDGSPVVVVYAGGCCKSDDLRRHRKGGYSVLNAFELIRLGDAPPAGE